MRRSLLRSGVLPAAAVLVLLAGCGGSDDEASTAAPEETSASETTASETTESEEPTGSEFCTEAASIQERINGSAAAAGDPSQLPQIFREAAEEIRAIEAPSELEQDWGALADGAEQFATTLEDVDLTDPNALATLQEQLAPLEQQLTSASTNVQNYLVEECDMEMPAEESAPAT
ncbi:hypothetical protein [Blastococcus xanthinilyticus]|uniref:Uncharacterized protein n=1 Tax=Blastococcus xanthinilyticus TaxID=1564164 RepID=A0A5S5CVR7_9ACTN|nr:hypothetical protein [Blastococcus xanthinilyticus]TYP87877.1 hypothetical protein BD833_10551 [Blastococcus xanthinilyticus]